MERISVLTEVHDWVQKGFEITYYIVNQVENGYQENVINGEMPNFTYTFTVHKNYEEIFLLSVNSLEEGYSKTLKFLKKNY